MVANRPALGHPAGYVHLTSSAARAHPVPAQPVCNGVLLLLWVLSVADQASMILIASTAYRESRLRYHSSASAYADSASCRSSLHPTSGTECEPQSTSARGAGLRDREPYALDFIDAYAEAHGCAPAFTLPRTKSSCARLTTTPGCAKTGGAPAPLAGRTPPGGTGPPGDG